MNATTIDRMSAPSLVALAAAVPSALLGAFLGTLVAGPSGLLICGIVGAGSGALAARALVVPSTSERRA